MSRRNAVLATLLASAALALGSGCSHHAGHHARGEEHWHNAIASEDVHEAPEVHRQDSHPDSFHAH